MPLTSGTQLGPYKILAPLGAGGMGEVYRARDTRLGREVAIKVIHAEVARDPDQIKRFDQEARAASVSRSMAIKQSRGERASAVQRNPLRKAGACRLQAREVDPGGKTDPILGSAVPPEALRPRLRMP